jgi:hypothetical protein
LLSLNHQESKTLSFKTETEIDTMTDNDAADQIANDEALDELDALLAEADAAAAEEVVEETIEEVDATPKVVEAETPDEDECGVTAAEAASSGDAIGEAPKEKKKKASKPRVTFDKSSDALFHKIGEDGVQNLILTTDDAELDANKRRDMVATAVDGFAKKVQEKAVNMLAVAATGEGKLSVYSEIALKMLFDKGEMTSAELREAYTSGAYDAPKAYGAGTASAQSGQMVKLLPELKIVKKDGTKMTLNEDSVLAAALKDALAA